METKVKTTQTPFGYKVKTGALRHTGNSTNKEKGNKTK